MYALPPPIPKYSQQSCLQSSDSFEQLMNIYGLNRMFVDEIPQLFPDDYGQSSYSPVQIAASSYSHIPLLSRPCTSSFQSPSTYQPHSFMRRRSSLVEALNNGILAPIYPSDHEDNAGPKTCEQRRRRNRKKYPDVDEEKGQEERLKMLRRRAIVRPNQPSNKYPTQQDDFQPPRALLRSYNHQMISREKRAQSQPLHQHNSCNFGNTDDSDDEITKLVNQRHISRADRFSTDSETGRYSQDSGINIRSSTHSNSSTTTSTISSDDQNMLFKAEAVFDHVAMLTDELPFSAGDSIQILDTTNPSLWYGACRNRTGWFPRSYVAMRTPDANRLNSTLIASNHSLEDYPKSMRYLRRKVIEELMHTERDYMTLLRNLTEGFVEQCRRRREMFPEEKIRKIFGNIDQILVLHSKLSRDLELAFVQKSPEDSCIANAFLRNSQNFGVYTEYCNNRPVSCAELDQLQRQPQFHHFFEACRLLRGMPKLNLEGFLLTPVQRICRYPLQLLELLKATPETHPDRYLLEKAQAIMKATAGQINDNKRRIDAIQKIILWQRNVHGFRGPDLVESNNRILLSGEMLCRAVMRNSVQWTKTVHVYLFDQTIVLCKKDVLKKGSLVFKDRVSLQCSSVIDLPDGKELVIDANLKNSFKVMSSTREYFFTCPDNATKSIWLDSLRSRPALNPPTVAEKRLALITLAI